MTDRIHPDHPIYQRKPVSVIIRSIRPSLQRAAFRMAAYNARRNRMQDWDDNAYRQYLIGCAARRKATFGD